MIERYNQCQQLRASAVLWNEAWPLDMYELVVQVHMSADSDDSVICTAFQMPHNSMQPINYWCRLLDSLGQTVYGNSEHQYSCV